MASQTSIPLNGPAIRQKKKSILCISTLLTTWGKGVPDWGRPAIVSGKTCYQLLTSYVLLWQLHGSYSSRVCEQLSVAAYCPQAAFALHRFAHWMDSAQEGCYECAWAPPLAASTALFKQQCCYSEWLIEGRSNTVKDFIQNKGWAHHHASGATEGATRAWLGSKRTRSKEQAAPSRLCRGNWCVVPSFFAVSVNQTVVCVSQNAGAKVVSVWANLAH